MSRLRAPLARQRGVTLIEVLVAVFILSIGMLAGAGMQLAAMRENQSALYRSNALLLAEDMVARMRANPEGAAGGAYDGADTDLAVTTDGCLQSGCTSNQLALADIASWRAGFDATAYRLPARRNGRPPRGTIEGQADGVYAITLEWADTVERDDADTSLTLRFRP